MTCLPPFPTDPETLNLLHTALHTALHPGLHAERSSLGEFCQLLTDLGGGCGETGVPPP